MLNQLGAAQLKNYSIEGVMFRLSPIGNNLELQIFKQLISFLL